MAIANVVTAFANAPVTNTDVYNGHPASCGLRQECTADLWHAATDGVTPTWGALSMSDALTETAHLGEMGGESGYSWAAFDQIKQTHFSPGRAAVFHYNMWIHSLP